MHIFKFLRVMHYCYVVGCRFPLYIHAHTVNWCIYASSETSVKHRPPKWQETMDTPTKYREYMMSVMLVRPLYDS